MNEYTKPPLPEPYEWRARGSLFPLASIIAQGWTDEAEGVFTGDQAQAHADACVAVERDRCAGALNITRAEASLAAGEMTLQEWRTCAAVLRWVQDRIRSLK